MMSMRRDLHRCPVIKCPRSRRKGQILCPIHWRALPKWRQDEIWDSYTRNGPGTEAHRLVVFAAIEELCSIEERRDEY